MSGTRIHIISFSNYEPKLLKSIAGAVRNEFGIETIITEGHLDISDYFDPSRSQYKGNELLQAVESFYSGSNKKIIGIFNVDLFIPILTFIYGQAYLGGSTAIASSHRLSNARYGLKEDPVVFRERLIKEVIHELGHTFGLIHCYMPSCVMRSSTYVEDIDQKSHHICNKCRATIEG